MKHLLYILLLCPALCIAQRQAPPSIIAGQVARDSAQNAGIALLQTGKLDLSIYTSYTATVASALAGKQASLVSGTNIKTINGTSLLGSGDIVISGGGTSTPTYSTTALTTAELQRVFNAATADTRINLMPGAYNFGESAVTLNLGGKRGVTIDGRKEVTFVFGSVGRLLVNGSDSTLTINGIVFSCTATTGNTVATGQGLLDVNELGSHSDPTISNCEFYAPNCLRNGISWNTYSATADGGNGTTAILRRLKARNCRFGPLGRMGAEILNHTWSDGKVITTIDGIDFESCEFYDLGRVAETNGVYNGMSLSVSGRAKNIRYVNNGCVDAKTYGLEIVGNEGVVIEGSTFNYINNSYIPISLADGYGNGSDATKDITVANCYMRSKTRPMNSRGTTGINLSNNTFIGTTDDNSPNSNLYFQKCTGISLTGGSVSTGSYNPLRFDDCKQVVIDVPRVTGTNTTSNYASISIYAGTGYTGAGASDYRIRLNGSIYKKNNGITTTAGSIYELQPNNGTITGVVTY